MTLFMYSFKKVSVFYGMMTELAVKNCVSSDNVRTRCFASAYKFVTT
jgi:hypothetical protein